MQPEPSARAVELMVSNVRNVLLSHQWHSSSTSSCEDRRAGDSNWITGRHAILTHVPERDDPAAMFIPKREAHAAKALIKRPKLASSPCYRLPCDGIMKLRGFGLPHAWQAPRAFSRFRFHRGDAVPMMTCSRVALLWMAGIFVVTGIAHTTAASELTASDVEYLKTIAGFQSPRFLRDMTPAETSCMHELINRPGDENERSRVVSAFVGWIVLGQVSGDRTPPQTCPPE